MYSLSWSETACPMQWLLCCASLYPEFWVAVPFTLWAAVLTVKALCALRVSLGVSWYSLQVPGAVTVTPWGGERSALGTCWAEPRGPAGWAGKGKGRGTAQKELMGYFGAQGFSWNFVSKLTSDFKALSAFMNCHVTLPSIFDFACHFC